jgi:hypothetical protein
MLINIIVVLIVVGVLLWLVNNYIPMDGKIKSILNAVVVICVVIWLLQAFGVIGSLNSVGIRYYLAVRFRSRRYSLEMVRRTISFAALRCRAANRS